MPRATPGERVAKHRRSLNVSQSELARRTGLHPSAISRIEAGERRIYADTLDALREALGVPVTRFYE